MALRWRLTGDSESENDEDDKESENDKDDKNSENDDGITLRWWVNRIQRRKRQLMKEKIRKDDDKMSTMIVQRRPEGLAEGECRYRFSKYEEGRQSWGRNAHAKQPGCRAKVISYSVLA